MPASGLVQLVQNKAELQSKVEENGSKVTVAFLCLDIVLTREILRGNFYPYLESVASAHRHISFLSMTETEEISVWDTNPGIWNVPSFLVFKNGRELEEVCTYIKILSG
jgi:hypothetical protein